MKMTSIAILVGALPAIMAGGLRATTAADPAPGNAHCPVSSDTIPEGLTAADWTGIRAAYEAGRHVVAVLDDGTLAARNPGQGWITCFDGRGFTVTPDTGGWTWGLELRSYGFPGAERKVAGKGSVSDGGGKVDYNWDTSLREWFVNDRRGLQQGWTIGDRPAGSEDGGPLRLEFAVRGGLKPDVAANGAGVGFLDPAGARVLDFGGLKAWDADGKVLAARFETADRTGGDTALRVAVEESGARYPVTIDPLAQQAYLKASNTDKWDSFGEAVAISGDTVVVGAYGEGSNATGVNGDPGDNSAPHSGAAYVFLNAPTPLSEIAVEQPPGTDLADGTAVVDFGSVVVEGVTASRTFTVRNTGVDALTLGTVAVGGAHPADFTVTTQPYSPVEPAGSTTFTVQFDPSAAGVRSATLSLVTNDADENPFDFGIEGGGVTAVQAFDQAVADAGLSGPDASAWERGGKARNQGQGSNPLSPALRSGPTAVSGASRQKQIPPGCPALRRGGVVITV